jgi:hypothetical protein
MHRRRLGQLVREVDDEAIAASGANQGSRQAAVVSPRIRADSWDDLQRLDARIERDFDNIGVWIGINCVSELQVCVPSSRLQALGLGEGAGRKCREQQQAKNHDQF